MKLWAISAVEACLEKTFYNLFDHYKTREIEKKMQEKIRRATQHPSFANISLVTVYQLQFAQFDKSKNKQNIDILQKKYVLGYSTQ